MRAREFRPDPRVAHGAPHTTQAPGEPRVRTSNAPIDRDPRPLTPPRPRLALALLALAGATSLASMGCGAAFGPRRAGAAPSRPAARVAHEPRARDIPPPLAVDTPDDAVVRVTNGELTCTGTLVADDLVLTAHHCVTARDARPRGAPRDASPSALAVELGGDYLPWGTVAVRAVVAPPCGHAGGRGDVAVLVLERHLVGVATLAPRLDRGPDPAERVAPVGFGRCQLSSDAIRRVVREGGAVERVAPASFVASASVCPGDSGGPARSEVTGEVVGVVSTAAMDGSDRTREPATFTRLDAFRLVLGTARMIADGASPAEIPPVGGCDD